MDLNIQKMTNYPPSPGIIVKGAGGLTGFDEISRRMSHTKLRFSFANGEITI